MTVSRNRHCPLAVAVAALTVLVVLASCDRGSGGSSDATPNGRTYRVAHFAASSQNGFNKAIFDGIASRAKEYGNVQVEIIDGKFEAQVQFNQVQDAATSGKYDAFVVTPNDSVSLAAAVQQATAARIPVVSTLFPIGTELDRLEPQVPGLTSTVAVPVTTGAKAQARAVVDWCAGKRCRVAVLIGQLRFPFDKLRHDTYKSVLAGHANITIVATGEGNYDRDLSLKAMQDILQAHRDVNVVLSNADQHVFGAQVAIENAGMNPASMYLMGGGGSAEGIAAVRGGKWQALLCEYPRTMGAKAMEQIHNALTGAPVQPAVNLAENAPLPLIVDAKVLGEHPDFTGEWVG